MKPAASPRDHMHVLKGVSHGSEEEMNRHRDLILTMIQRKNPWGVTWCDLVDDLGITKSSAATRLVELEREGKIESAGHNRNGAKVFVPAGTIPNPTRKAMIEADLTDQATIRLQDKLIKRLRMEIRRALSNIGNEKVLRAVLEEATTIE